MQPDDWEALEEEKENKNRLEIRWVGVATEPAGMWARSGWDSNSAVVLPLVSVSVSLCLPTSCRILARKLPLPPALLGRIQQQQAAAAAGGLPPGTAPAFSATEAEDLEHQVGKH